MQESDGLQGTQVQEIIEGLNLVYAGIEVAQEAWKRVSPVHCQDGCGSCCVNFEPDVLESEALYLAAWMLFHQRERAEAILEGTFESPRKDTGNGCFLFDPDSAYHCTVYGGRALICRLFGYSGDRGKDDRPRWRSCKVLGEGYQYDEKELLEKFGAVPPIMSDITARVLALMPDRIQERRPLNEALPLALGKILMLRKFVNI